MQHAKPKARIRLPYQVEYPHPIEVKAGESVQVGRSDDEYPGWLWCRAADGCEGWMPLELLSRQEGSAIALQDYSAKELAVQPGDEVEIEEARHGWVLVRNAQRERGWIPQSHIEL